MRIDMLVALEDAYCYVRCLRRCVLIRYASYNLRVDTLGE